MENYYYGNPWINGGSYYPYPYSRSNSSPGDFYRYSNPNPSPYRNQSPNPSPYRNQNPTPVSKPRVVSVPVHYVNSDSPVMPSLQRPTVPVPVVEPLPLSAETAVLRLQKVMRGFFVRKNVKILTKIEVEVEEIAREIIEKEEVLERDEKDRIRIGEMLMRLLFKLDSVRGVRDYRKKVIKRVISLQEKVDSIGTDRDNKEETDEKDSDPIEVDNSDDSIAENPNSLQAEKNKIGETINSIDETPIEAHFDLNYVEATSIEPVDSSKTIDIDEFNGEGNSIHKEDWDVMVEKLNLDEGLDKQGPKSSSNEMEMKGLRQAMERMVTESQKMKTLMEDICQTNIEQWQLMEGLVNRVHRLERTVEKMEKHKKKKGNKKKGKCGQWKEN